MTQSKKGQGKGRKLTVSEGAVTYRTQYIIDDQTPNDEIYNPVINGQVMAHGLVPRDYSIYPRQMFQPPAEMPVLDDSALSAICKEQEKEETSLEHLFNRRAKEKGISVPFLHQNGHGYCHTADTEVLTERGWVGWPDYNGTDLLGTMNRATGLLEFQAPLARQVFEYSGEMVHSTNRRIDFGVTPNHRMLVRKWDERRRTLSDAYSFVHASDMGWYVGLPHATRGFIGTELKRVAVEGDREYDGDDFIAMLGLVTSDGYAGGTEKTKNWVSFASFRESSRAEIEPLALRLGFHESPSKPGVWIRYDAGALANWMRANCYTDPRLGAEHKRVPDVVKCGSMRQISHFLHYFDDRNRSGLQFWSKSKRMIDDLQELHLRIGKRCHIGKTEAKDSELAGKIIHGHGGYALTVGDVDRLCLDRKKHLTTDRYHGLVYCATVPNSTLVTRRNGSVLVSGNCWGYSTGNTEMLDRAARNMPYVRLNPHAVCAIIKGGRDEGGWCGLSAKFFAEIGCPTEEFWKVHSRDLKQDTPEMRANAAKHKLLEDWQDLTASIYDRSMADRLWQTCLASNIPGPMDWDEWGHSVCAGRLVEVEKGFFRPRILNSWLGWGDNGWGTIARGWTVDSCLMIRSTGASTN
jgi:hypothetical protein